VPREEQTVEIEMTVVAESKKAGAGAWLLKGEDYKGKVVEVWIPKSQIRDMDGCMVPGDTGNIEMTLWIARKKDLVEPDEDDD
jgi:hypothetical protein